VRLENPIGVFCTRGGCLATPAARGRTPPAPGARRGGPPPSIRLPCNRLRVGMGRRGAGLAPSRAARHPGRGQRGPTRAARHPGRWQRGLHALQATTRSDPPQLRVTPAFFARTSPAAHGPRGPSPRCHDLLTDQAQSLDPPRTARHPGRRQRGFHALQATTRSDPPQPRVTSAFFARTSPAAHGPRGLSPWCHDLLTEKASLDPARAARHPGRWQRGLHAPHATTRSDPPKLRATPAFFARTSPAAHGPRGPSPRCHDLCRVPGARAHGAALLCRNKASPGRAPSAGRGTSSTETGSPAGASGAGPRPATRWWEGGPR